MPVTFALAVLGSDSAGSSCAGNTVFDAGRLRPNASAFRPFSATLDLTVTSNEPEPSAAAVCVTLFGDVNSEPTVVWNGTLNLSPLKPTPCWTTAIAPEDAGAVTISSS